MQSVLCEGWSKSYLSFVKVSWEGYGELYDDPP